MQENKLKKHFPLIRSREEVLQDIQENPELERTFRGWVPEQQKEFLDFCTGVRGIKLLYDPFFKEIMSPESTPERLEEFLTLLLGQKVKILSVLPNDSTRLADENVLLITDIVVELEDHSIADLEIQKIGWLFPGQRSACYSADMLLRQYKRVRSTKKKRFSYRDIKDVYTIVLFEKSAKGFREFPEEYIHYFEQRSNTGLEMELLQKYIFIPLDIFHEIQQNKPIRNRLDAWLIFLGEDDPEMIEKLITQYPEFKAIYEQNYALCANVERVMDMYSEELRILDHNTVMVTLDEQHEELEAYKVWMAEKKAEVEAQAAEIEAHKVWMAEKNAEVEAQAAEIEAHKVWMAEKNAEVEAQAAEIEAHKVWMAEKNAEVDAQAAEIEAHKVWMAEKNAEVEAQAAEIEAQQQKIDSYKETMEVQAARIAELECLLAKK